VGDEVPIDDFEGGTHKIAQVNIFFPSNIICK
jgi:hypothetical protein